MTESQRSLTVLIIDEDTGRSALLKRALTDAGYSVVLRIASTSGLVERVREFNPDIIIVELDSPDRDTLEHMQAVSRDQPRPIVMFAEDEDTRTIEKAIRAGVSAYVVDDIASTRVRPVLDVAIARFREYQALRNELEKTRHTLAERKVVDQAKGLLMKQRGIDEQAAYQLLRKAAMDGGQRIAEVSRNLIRAAELLR